MRKSFGQLTETGSDGATEITNVRHRASDIETTLACASLGSMYGAVSGAVYGAARLFPFSGLALLGAGVGVILGAMGGCGAGLIAGVGINRAGIGDGSLPAWSIGGSLAGGTLTAFLLLTGDDHVIWNVVPLVTGAALGVAVGVAAQEASRFVPGVAWLIKLVEGPAENRDR